MPMYKGWKPDVVKVTRAGRIGAKKSPWRDPITPEKKAQLKRERIARLRQMGIHHG